MTKSSDPEVLIFADGACSGNPGPGGWGAVLEFPATGAEKRLAGAESPTTNNRMEMTAVIQALSSLTRACRVRVVTDSRYVVDGFNAGWLAKWERNNWLTSNKTPVKNMDLWRALKAAASRHQVEWQWIHGHSGHPGNEAADRLAVAARLELEGRGGK
jgi:ribonuclease HI